MSETDSIDEIPEHNQVYFEDTYYDIYHYESYKDIPEDIIKSSKTFIGVLTDAGVFCSPNITGHDILMGLVDHSILNNSIQLDYHLKFEIGRATLKEKVKSYNLELLQGGYINLSDLKSLVSPQTLHEMLSKINYSDIRKSDLNLEELSDIFDSAQSSFLRNLDLDKINDPDMIWYYVLSNKELINPSVLVALNGELEATFPQDLDFDTKLTQVEAKTLFENARQLLKQELKIDFEVDSDEFKEILWGKILLEKGLVELSTVATLYTEPRIMAVIKSITSDNITRNVGRQVDTINKILNARADYLRNNGIVIPEPEPIIYTEVSFYKNYKLLQFNELFRTVRGIVKKVGQNFSTVRNKFYMIRADGKRVDYLVDPRESDAQLFTRAELLDFLETPKS